ncbi:hypothetical protein [Chelativorans sp. AA-79]|uniref:hypothetical protein n=1 Tax=Chelativorans sp. AA-79 TaxID=3028735 RepID=UPI0023F8CDA2|nr:hypothetical protein [Chelativorans sp. AA-79]WEX07376.1 hypothetical protein PVE73_14725 [Chelativorans sp. AA-79]
MSERKFVKIKMVLSGDVRTVAAEDADTLTRRKQAVLVRGDTREKAVRGDETEKAVK